MHSPLLRDRIGCFIIESKSTTFEITRAKGRLDNLLTQKPTGIDKLSYTGEAQNLIQAGKINEEKSKDGKLKYSLDNKVFVTDIPQGTKAQVYTIYYKVEDDPNTEQMETKEKRYGWRHLAATVLTALLVGGGAGYLLGYKLGNSTSAPSENVTPQVEQTVPQNEQPQVAEEQTTTAETETEPQEVEDDTTPIWEKYNDMDPRTSSGYYYITGLDRTETAKAGDNSARLARRYFGAAELACYIEVFNGIDGRTVLEEGTEVKIPKIEPKKNVRKRIQQQNNQQ